MAFLDSRQSELNFDQSFVGIHQVLREISLSEHEFQIKNFGQLCDLGGIKFVISVYKI